MSSGSSIGVWINTARRYTPETLPPGRFAVREDCKTLITTQSGLPLTFSAAMPTIGMRQRPLMMAFKRAIDVAGSLFGLALFAPLLVIVAIIIKSTSPGPVLFRQTRAGYAGRPFVMLKFRSLHVEACDDAGATQVTDGDPRITAVGRFLRRSNIDELPQFINILRGEMSLVGPRPHTFGMRAAGMRYDALVPYYHLRETMKPGLSGWAQVNGFRGDTTDPLRARARIDHDLAYIENFSIWLDLGVIALTLIRETFGGTGR